MNSSIVHIVVRTAAATLGIVMLGTGVIGHFRAPTRPWERAALLAGAVLLIFPGTLSDLAGVACAVVVWVAQAARIAGAPRAGRGQS
jgi:TRAP-type uncharacterized transport system fused permease subunit